jgi:hypothetical protein
MRGLADVFDEHFYETGRGSVWRFDTSEEAAKHLLAECRDGDLLLIKGSNGMKMNRIVEAFRKRYDEDESQLRPTTRERPIGDPLPEFIRSARNSRTAAA